MQTTVLLPQLELTMESVQVAGWLVQAGDTVAAGQPIIEIETQKSVVEVPAPAAGTVRKLCVAKGDTIGEKAPLCVITSTADEALEDPSFVPPSGTSEGPALPSREVATGAAAGGSSAAPAAADPGGGIRAAPAARKLAADLGIDIATVKGTGPGGRISLDDVKNATR